MSVVAASVHDAFVLRSELEAGLLVDRQRVEVCPQGYPWGFAVLMASRDFGDDACLSHSAPIGDTETVELLADLGRRARLAKRELGITMKIPSKVYESFDESRVFHDYRAPTSCRSRMVPSRSSSSLKSIAGVTISDKGLIIGWVSTPSTRGCSKVCSAK